MIDGAKFWINHRPFQMLETDSGWYFIDLERDHESDVFPTAWETQQAAMKYALEQNGVDAGLATIAAYEAFFERSVYDER